MLSPTPAVRAAILGLLVVTAIAVAGAGLHLVAAERAARSGAQAELQARADLAAVVVSDLAAPAVPRRVRALAETGNAELMVYDSASRLVAATDPDLARSADWLQAPSLATSGATTTRQGAHLVASAATASGARVVAVARAADGLPQGAVLETIAAMAALWGLLVGVLVVMAWYTGPRTATQLSLLGERIAQGDADGKALIRHAQLWLGPLADAFEPVVRRFRAQAERNRDVEGHVAALYQINPHYVLLCSQDGEIVEANPAFYAATGLPFAAVRGGRIESLRETFPIEPLLELAGRSLREGSAVTGLEYALIDRDDQTRPVEVSLRGFELDGREMVLFQATDQAREKQLERRVAAFTDTLDLMVDQRVHQLSAGQQTLNRLLDAAGVIIASFDAGGATSRWSGGARALTGRAIAQVGHFAAATSALGLSASERTAFTQWFWSPTTDPFVGRHGVVGGDGVSRVRQIVWRRVDADMGGRSDLRSLVGVEVPSFLVLPEIAGDGLAGAEPVQS